MGSTEGLVSDGLLPLSVSTFYFQSHANRVTLSSPPLPHITKLKPSPAGDRWALNLGPAPWVSRCGRGRFGSGVTAEGCVSWGWLHHRGRRTKMGSSSKLFQTHPRLTPLSPWSSLPFPIRCPQMHTEEQEPDTISGQTRTTITSPTSPECTTKCRETLHHLYDCAEPPPHCHQFVHNQALTVVIFLHFHRGSHEFIQGEPRTEVEQQILR